MSEATRSHRSSDGGETMTQDLATNVHEDSHELWIDPTDGAHIILGNDGGLFRSYDYGDNWDFLGGLPVAQSKVNSAPSLRVRLATERMTRSSHNRR